MSFATLGWGTWWLALLVRTVVPDWRFGLGVPGTLGCVFAVLGLAVAVFTVRAKRSWLLFTLIPLFANGSLLFVPWLASRWSERGAG